MKIKLFFFSLLFAAAFSVQAQDQLFPEYKQMIAEGTHSVQEVIAAGEAYFENRDKGRGSGYKQFKRWEYMSLRLMNEDGYLPTLDENLQELQRYNAYLNETADSRQRLNDNWQELGPSVLNVTTSWSGGVGRITGIAVDLTNTDHLIMGANTGGIWRSIDDGQSWEVLTDDLANIDVYSVAIDPSDSDTYFFGSTNGLIFKSTDAGATWSELGDVGASIVNKILIDPGNTDIIFATSQNDGIFRSTDAGTTWTNVIPSEDFGFDVEFSANDTSIVFASGLETYRSTDGGATFTQLNIPATDTAAEMIGISQSNPDVIYVVRGNGDFRGLFKSENGGDTFVELVHPGRNFFNASLTGTGTGGQAPRDMDVVVNPNNEDEVHIAGVNQWRSMDGGVNFEISAHWFIPEQQSNNIGYSHADIDFLMFVGDALYAATDGGIFRAPDSSAPISTSYFEDLTNDIGIRQHYLIDAAQSSDNVTVAGGSQDNGSSVYRENTNDWVDYIGADGGGTVVRRTNPNQIFGTTQFGNIFRTTTAGENLFGVNTPPGQGPFVTQMDQDPEDTSIYIGYNRIYRSPNSGGTWTGISQVFSEDVTDFQVAGSDNQVIYAAVGTRVFKTEDGGATSWSFSSPGAGFITSIAVNPVDSDMVAVTGTSNQKVFVTTDGGETWEGRRLNLPNFAALSVEWDNNGKNGLYLGMNYGVYYIDSNLDEWETYSNNLPNVRVNDLVINNETDMLYAGTYGRGLWVSPLVEDGVLGTSDFAKEDFFSISPNPANTQVSLRFEQPIETDIRVFDVTGKLMMYNKDVTVGRNYNLDISQLQSGIYFIRVNTGAGTATEKLIKN